jgi:hypothetical protein
MTMLDRFKALPLGIQLAAAALASSVPRYVLAFLRADGVTFTEGWRTFELFLLAISASAIAVTVTAGAAYVPHVAATSQAAWWKRGALFGLWLPVLLFEVVILSPALLSTMRAAPLACTTSGLVSTNAASAACVLQAAWLGDVAWSVVSIAAAPFTAMVCVIAAALAQHPALHVASPVTDAAPDATPMPQDATPSVTPDATPSARQRAWALLDDTRGSVAANDMAARLSISPSTARSYRAAWQRARAA